MGRGTDLLDDLIEEAPQGAANALEIAVWLVALVLAGLVLVLLVVVLLVVL